MEIIFPIVGHSFIPPDRVFARIEKSVKSKESIVSPAEYISIYEKYGTVVRLNEEDCPVLDFKNESIKYCKLPGNWHFKFNPTKRFELSKRIMVLLRFVASFRTFLMSTRASRFGNEAKTLSTSIHVDFKMGLRYLKQKLMT